MDAINNKSINDAALAKAEDKLKKLGQALGKVDRKDFVFAPNTGNPFLWGALRMPHAIK